MACTIHFNVTGITVNSQTIAQPLTVSVTYDVQSAASTSTGDAHSQHLNVGPKSRTVTITAHDPTTVLAAVVASAGACTFSVEETGDATAGKTITLADGTNEKCVGSGFEWDSGNPGEFGVATGTFQLTSNDFTEA